MFFVLQSSSSSSSSSDREHFYRPHINLSAPPETIYTHSHKRHFETKPQQPGRPHTKVVSKTKPIQTLSLTTALSRALSLIIGFLSLGLCGRSDNSHVKYKSHTAPQCLVNSRTRARQSPATIRRPPKTHTAAAAAAATHARGAARCCIYYGLCRQCGEDRHTRRPLLQIEERLAQSTSIVSVFLGCQRRLSRRMTEMIDWQWMPVSFAATATVTNFSPGLSAEPSGYNTLKFPDMSYHVVSIYTFSEILSTRVRICVLV